MMDREEKNVCVWTTSRVVSCNMMSNILFKNNICHKVEMAWDEIHNEPLFIITFKEDQNNEKLMKFLRGK